MVVDWALFPLVLLAVCLGCGLLVQRAGGWRMPGALVLPIGLALVVVVSSLTTSRAQTAPITTPLVVALAVAGYGVSWRRLRAVRVDPWMAAVGVGIYAICAAPLVLSGNGTWLGYFVDSDPAFHFELIAWLMAHGRDLTGLPTVSYSAVPNVVHQYIGTSYPFGADVALGAVRPLVGRDIAWIYQPYLAALLAFGAVSLQQLIKGVVRSRPLAALCAFIAGQSGLAYAFYLQASVKEIATALVITTTIVLVIELLRGPLTLRALVPLAVVVLAGYYVYSATVVPWLGIPLAAFVVISAWRLRKAMTARRAVRASPIPRWQLAAGALGLVVVVVLAIPIVRSASNFASVATSVLSQKADLGNLAAPLQKWQVLGIWPNGDFRFPTMAYRNAYVLLGAALVGAVLGLVWMVRRRAWGPLLLVLGNGIAALYLLSRSSPYASSKVLMIFSITAVLVCMIGAVALHDAGLRIGGWVLAAAIGAGVLWTNLLAYHDSSVAPQARFRELASIDSRFSGRGPAFYDLWDTFGVYFLRDVGVGIPDTFAGPAPQPAGLPPHPFGQLSLPWDTNEVDQSYLQGFRLLILGRSPILTRPPANYRMIYQGRYYTVWQKQASPVVVRHLPISIGSQDVQTRASCRTVLGAATLATRDHARIAYVASPEQPTLVPTRSLHPTEWAPVSPTPHAAPQFLSLGQSQGGLVGTIRVPASGRYQVWLEGSFSRRTIVKVGGRLVGTIRHQIGTSGQFLDVGTVSVSAGEQRVVILRPASYYAPGNVVAGELLGPLVLTRTDAPPPVQYVAPSAARSLCGRPLEWIEIVRP